MPRKVRIAALAPLLFLTASAAPVPTAPNVVVAGQVLATLNDWRAIVFTLLVIVALLLFALLSLFAVMLGTIRKQAAAAAETAVALREANDVARGVMATISRIESRLPS